jgi:hypothetical protein
MSNRLYLHAGAEPIDTAGLATLVAPEPTSTWCPLHHEDYANSIKDTLHFMGARIITEQYAIKPGDTGGDEFFGLIELEHDQLDIPTGSALGLGFRNSWNQRFAANGILARHTFVCDNMAFAGTDAFHFNRKNTPGLSKQLPQIMASAMMNFLHSAKSFLRSHAAMDTHYLKDIFETDHENVAVDHVCVELAAHEAVSWRNVRRLREEITRPDGPGGFFPRTARDIHFGDVMNAVTEVEKLSLSPISTPERMSRAHNILTHMIEVAT